MSPLGEVPITPAGAHVTADPISQHDRPAASLCAALTAGDLDLADRCLQQTDGSLPTAALRPAAELHMYRRRWSEAVRLFDLMDGRDQSTQMKRCLAANMAEMQEHRPQLCQTLADAPCTGSYRIIAGAAGQPTILDCSDPQKPLILSSGGDPRAAVGKTFQKLAPTFAEGGAIAVCGMTDGYLVGVLAHNPPQLFMDQQQTVYVIEPDAHLALICLMIHDYTGPNGPIVQDRFRWFLGPQWTQSLDDELFRDFAQLLPDVLVSQPAADPAIGPRVTEVVQKLNQHLNQLAASNQAYYAAKPTEQLLAVMADHPPRQPRVLLITSRFTTVLQYATRDAAEAFKRVGWDTQIIIEPSPRHRTTSTVMRHAIDRFKPDLVVQLDHLRSEAPGIVPDQLPVICWIQDHLPNLTTPEAGASVGKRDFVLSFAGPMFIDAYHYPARQIIDMPMMLAAPVARPVSWASDGDDLVYVSNVSQQPSKIADQLCESVGDGARPLVREVCDQIMQIYAAGRSVDTVWQIRDLLQHAFRRRVGRSLDVHARNRLADHISVQLNIALYRQQGLCWIAQAADELGATLAVYGRGWEDHPDFGRFARGVVTHGPDLQELTRRTKINLNLEPYTCYSHHRMLDALVAGGFVLVREHRSNQLLQDVSRFLAEHADASVATAAQALEAIDPQHMAELKRLLADGADLTYDDKADVVKHVRACERAGVLVPGAEAMPHLDEVSFADAATCRRRIERFLADPDARSRISARQREAVEQRLTFPVGMKRVVDRIRELIAAENDGQA